MRVLDLFSGIGGFSVGLERAGMTKREFQYKAMCKDYERRQPLAWAEARRVINATGEKK
jgi:hypothetical protein